MPGDGIGKTVLPESIRVLNAVGFEAEYVHGDIGWDFWCSEGNALPQRTIDLLKQHKLGLFGAITSIYLSSINSVSLVQLPQNQKMQQIRNLIHH